MELIQHFFDLFVHLDDHLHAIIRAFGAWTYVILFLVIFCETGLVVTPFLPGDSLLFATGALAASGSLSATALFLLLCAAAILGDTVNYWIGERVGVRVFRDDARILKTSYLRKTEEFFEKYGGKTIILARFIPVVRTFAPVVAGVAEMDYRRFVTFNVVGGVVWGAGVTLAGYLLGSSIHDIDRWLLPIIGLIVAISFVPVALEFLKARRRNRTPQ